jgi:hypothetical protein
MSYVYDVQRRVWTEHIRPLVVARHGEIFTFVFESLMEEMHSANHNVPSKDGVFKGDGINKDPGVHRAARELEEFVKNEMASRMPSKEEFIKATLKMILLRCQLDPKPIDLSQVKLEIQEAVKDLGLK